MIKFLGTFGHYDNRFKGLFPSVVVSFIYRLLPNIFRNNDHISMQIMVLLTITNNKRTFSGKMSNLM